MSETCLRIRLRSRKRFGSQPPRPHSWLRFGLLSTFPSLQRHDPRAGGEARSLVDSRGVVALLLGLSRLRASRLRALSFKRVRFCEVDWCMPNGVPRGGVCSEFGLGGALACTTAFPKPLA